MGVVLLSDEKIVHVTSSDTQVVVTQEQRIVSVAASGPPGPQGPIGPAGGDVFVYDRNGVPAATWPIVHNLNRLVHVTVILDNGDEVETDVNQSDLNVVSVVFAQPTSGKALVG